MWTTHQQPKCFALILTDSHLHSKHYSPQNCTASELINSERFFLTTTSQPSGSLPQLLFPLLTSSGSSPLFPLLLPHRILLLCTCLQILLFFTSAIPLLRYSSITPASIPPFNLFITVLGLLSAAAGENHTVLMMAVTLNLWFSASSGFPKLPGNSIISWFTLLLTPFLRNFISNLLNSPAPMGCPTPADNLNS